MTYLYHECDSIVAATFDDHLANCNSCRQQVSAWRMAQHDLDQSTVPSLPSHGHTGSVALPWAIAAVLAIGFAFLFGRLNGLHADLEQMRREAATMASPASPTNRSDQAPISEERFAALQRELADLETHAESLIAQQASETATAMAQLRHESQTALDQIQHQLETVALVGERRYQQFRGQHLASTSKTGHPSTQILRPTSNY